MPQNGVLRDVNVAGNSRKAGNGSHTSALVPRCGTMRGWLPLGEADVVDPHAPGRGATVGVHLEGDVDAAAGGGECVESLVDLRALAIEGDSHPDDFVVGRSCELPGQFVPGVGGRSWTGSRCRNPMHGGVIPNPPSAGATNVTLGGVLVTPSASILIDVELERLCSRHIGEVVRHLINEVRYRVVTADLLPPEGICPGRAAGDVELDGRSA